MSAADLFATHWIEAWNTHDIEAILSHYADDVVSLSPIALKREGIGRMVGDAAVTDASTRQHGAENLSLSWRTEAGED
ncbi:MAG: nuclear transport factor 2 family protein [Chakrabartia sp.]